MANDVTSAVATPHLFLAGQRTSAVAVGCSAPDTLDLYHECSRETSSGWLAILFSFRSWNLHLIRRFPLEGFDQSQIIIFNLIWHFFLSSA